MVRFVIGLSVSLLIMVYALNQTGARFGGDSRPQTGAKFISHESKDQGSSWPSFAEIAHAIGQWTGGRDEGREERRLPQIETHPTAGTMTFDDIAEQARAAMERAEAMGVATGPTAFDDYLARKDARGR